MDELKALTIEYKNNLRFNSRNDRKTIQMIEIFRRTSLNNFLVFKRVYLLLYPDQNELEIDFIFLLRMLSYSINFSSQEAISSSDVSLILDYVDSRAFSPDHMKLFFQQVLSLNTIKFIYESFENISIFNNTINTCVCKIIDFKVKLFEEIKKHYSQLLDEHIIYLEGFKVLKVKKFLIDHSAEDIFNDLYEHLIKTVNNIY